VTAGAVARAAVDHLVVAADTLAQGAAWCEATLGVAPDAGGRHALMATHNRVLAIGGGRFALAYLEIIAVDPHAPPPSRRRWFGLDDDTLRAALREQPRLIHWVARTPSLDGVAAAARGLGFDPGVAVAASRDTPDGTLRWRIGLTDDGRLQAGGAWPTWIEWQGPHPAERLPPRGVVLQSLALRGLPAPAQRLLGDAGLDFAPGPGAALEAGFDTPRGRVVLQSSRPAPQPSSATP
jgi:hypothetical protein